MSEEYRMEAYKIFELGVMSTRKRITEFFKDKFNVKRNTSLLEGINVVYIDDTVFSHKQNKQYLLEDMRKQLGQNVIGINLNEYMYITSLSQTNLMMKIPSFSCCQQIGHDEAAAAHEDEVVGRGVAHRGMEG